MNPEISIIAPVYNVEKYLKRCIDSILNQSFENFELILVDDGSTDNSGKIVDEYKDIQKELKKKFNANFRYILKNKKLNYKEKSVYVTFFINSKVCRFIYKNKLSLWDKL